MDGPVQQILLLLFVQQMVNLSDPNTVQIIRALFIAANGAYWYLLQGVPDAVKAKNDTRTIWVPIKKQKGIMEQMFPADGAPAPPQEWKKTTLVEHETELATKLVSGIFGSAIQPLLFSFAMNVQIMLAMSLVRLPMNAWKDPIVQKYILGNESVERPYEEVYEEPSTGAPITSASVADSAAGAVGAPTPAGAGKSGFDYECEEVVFQTWEAAQDPANIPGFESLFGAGKSKNINYRTHDNGWTCLMVVAGGSQNGKAEVRKLLELGALPTVADNEGWTALHWAAFHGCVNAIQAICDGYSKDKSAAICGDDAALKSLLVMRDHKGRTAYKVATEERNATEVNILKEAGKRVGLSVADMAAVIVPAAPANRERSDSNVSGGGNRRRAGSDDDAAAPGKAADAPVQEIYTRSAAAAAMDPQ